MIVDLEGYPYPGFSWSINQHVGPTFSNPKVLYHLLKAAHRHADDSNYQDRITQSLISEGLLTANMRSDAERPQAWRDYQQVLSEFGLIVSTRYTTGVRVSPIGLLWLDGYIGYSDMLATQCLRYQYPNGHKSDLSPRVKKLLTGRGLRVPQNRVDLDIANGVLVKPVVLVLRVLCMLARQGRIEGLTAGEIVDYLMPARTNGAWPHVVERLLQNRSAGGRDSSMQRHAQEWMRIMAAAGLGEVIHTGGKNRIRLTSASLKGLSAIEAVCEYHEHPSQFWMPNVELNEREVALSWYTYFGQPRLEAQWDATGPVADEVNILEYPEGVAGDEDESQITLAAEPGLDLKEFHPRLLYTGNSSGEIDSDKIRAGRIALMEKTLLHDAIVAKLATRLKERDFQVFEDRSSVDLLAKRGNDEIIFEVKTVTQKNIAKHLRAGVGQLSEYRYRSNAQRGSEPQAVLVTSTGFNQPSWMTGYFENALRMELIAFDGNDGFYRTANNAEYLNFI